MHLTQTFGPRRDIKASISIFSVLHIIIITIIIIIITIIIIIIIIFINCSWVVTRWQWSFYIV